MFLQQGLIQLALTFNQPLVLSTQARRDSIEERRETSLIQPEAET